MKKPLYITSPIFCPPYSISYPPAQSGKEERGFEVERKRFPHLFFHGFRSQLQPVTQSNHMGESGGVFFYKDICKEKDWKDSMEQNIDWHL